MKKGIRKIIAILSILAIIFSLSMSVFAVEPRASTNGYTSTNVVFNNKTYTISLGIGQDSSKGVRASAYCPIYGIRILVNGVRVVFDTENQGYYSQTGVSASGTTGSSGSYYVPTSYTYCPKEYPVIKVYSASTSATFYAVNNGSDVTISANFHAN